MLLPIYLIAIDSIMFDEGLWKLCMKFIYTSIGIESHLRSLKIENTVPLYAAENSWNLEFDVCKVHWKILVWRAIQYF